MRKEHKGFTLIELLIVIGIIGFLAAAILVAVDPVKRIQDSRDSQRWSEVNSLLNAILNHQVDTRAIFNGDAGAPIITSATLAQVIVEDTTGIVCSAPATRPGCSKALDTTAGVVCVADLLGATPATRLVPEYLAEIPQDPRVGTAPCSAGCATLGNVNIGPTNSGYYIQRTTGDRIEIGSCKPEQASTINVKR